MNKSTTKVLEKYLKDGGLSAQLVEELMNMVNPSSSISEAQAKALRATLYVATHKVKPGGAWPKVLMPIAIWLNTCHE